MTRKLRIYRFIDHSRGTRYAFVAAYSKNEVAKILNVPRGRLNGYCEDVSTGNHGYSSLEYGQVRYEDANARIESSGMSCRDFERIACLGYLKSASRTLNECTMPNAEMRKRLAEITEMVDELRADAVEFISDEYGGR